MFSSWLYVAFTQFEDLPSTRLFFIMPWYAKSKNLKGMHFLFSMAETVCVSLFSLKIFHLCNSCHYGCQLKITKDNFDITVNAEMFHIKTRPNIQNLIVAIGPKLTCTAALVYVTTGWSIDFWVLLMFTTSHISGNALVNPEGILWSTKS